MLSFRKERRAINQALALSGDQKTVETVNAEFLFNKVVFILRLVEHNFNSELKLVLEKGIDPDKSNVIAKITITK